MSSSTSSTQSSASGWVSYLLSTTSEHAVIFLNDAGVIVGWFGAAERLFGYTETEALGLDFGVLFGSDDRQLGLDRQEMAVAKDGQRSEDDRWHVRKDGSRFWGSGLLESVKQPDGTVSVFCKVVRDRTDIRAQLDTLQNRLSAQRNENERRTRIFVSLGHELRNLLGPLQNATMLMSEVDDPKLREKSLGVLRRQLSAMETLLNDLSLVSAAEVSVPRVKTEPVVVQEALELAVNSMRGTAKANRQELILTVPPVAFTVDADPLRLQQMLLNLLSNSLKYTPAGGHINVSATVESGHAVFRVTDDGIGISSDCLPHIFELFTRGDIPSTAPGLGVGLAVVKELVTMHGGSVEARSPGAGKGSVFALRLPLRHTGGSQV